MKWFFSLLLSFAIFLFSCTKYNELQNTKKNFINIATTINPNLNFALYMKERFPNRYQVNILRSPAEVIAVLKNKTADVFFHSILGYIKAYKKGLAEDYKVFSPYIYKAIYLITRKNLKKTVDIKLI